MPLVLQTETNPGAATFAVLADLTAAPIDEGIIPVALLNLQNPVAGETFGLGGDQYELQPAGCSVTLATNIAIVIEAAAADTVANAVAAINATNPTNQSASITQPGGLLPALANGTENVVAVANGGSLLLYPSDAPGGDILPGNPNLVLDTGTLANPEGWYDRTFLLRQAATINFNTYGGVPKNRRMHSTTVITVTANFIAQGDLATKFPFAVRSFFAQAHGENGVGNQGVFIPDDAIVISSSDTITITFNGGGAYPDLVVGDRLVLTAFSNPDPL